MSNRHKFALPADQEAIRAKCFHPSGNFGEFKKEEVELSIPARWEKIVRLYPDRLAIKTKDRSITYDELNRATNRVARELLTRRGTLAEPVGLLFEKGIPLIVAMLGVLKAGKCFVLLDPTFPITKLATILRNSRTTLVVSQQDTTLLAETINNDYELMTFESIRSATSSENLELPLVPTMPAYILYTSGSTGQPKGVFRSHRNALHNNFLFSNTFHYCEDDRFSLLASATALAVGNIFYALLNGASLLPFDTKTEGLDRLGAWLADEAISVCLISSPLFRNLCETLVGEETFPNLRLIRLTSEAVHKSDVELFKKYFPRTCVLANGLASSETGLLRTYFMNSDTEIDGSNVPVGYPVEDQEVLLVDANGKTVGFNAIGEIVVRSKYLSPGYWNQPELTTQKYSDSYDSEKRLYYTGDLGLMLRDGCLIHKGRKDFRVKIRGYGVDLVEVEKALLSHHDIREAVVVAPKSESGEARLIAYYSCQSEPGPTVSELRRFLKDQLADYMIPSTFFKLDTMPLTLNGKVDRQALPLPDNLRSNLDAPFVGPRDSTEEKLVKVWAEVLGLDRVGIHDNFFDLGGHSLLTARLCIQIQKQFGNKLPEVAIYHAPTVAQFAKILVQESWTAPWSLMAPIQPRGTTPPFFWSMEGDGDVRLVNYLDPNQPLYALVHQCRNGKRAIYHRLEDIAAHHLEEIRAIQPQGPYFLGGYCFGGMVAFEMAQQLQIQGEQVALLVLLDLADLKHCKTLRRQSAGESSPKLSALGNRVLRHLENLGKVSFNDKLTYVWVRVRATIRAAIGRGDDIVKNLACKVCWATGYPLSASLQGFNFSNVDIPILGAYELRQYSGRVILIKAKDSNWDAAFMKTLLTGEVEFHEVAGHHWDLRKEPFGRSWAEIVNAALEKTHNGVSAPDRRL
jgi:amino acid adenylation domain-containing protein